MLQDIREKSKGWIAYVVIGLIGLTFLIIGTGSFTLNQNKEVLAKVDGKEISKRDVEHYADRFLLQQGDKAAQFDSAMVKQMALDALIQDQAMMLASHQRGFRVSKDTIIRAINQDPAFLHEGNFSPELYRNLLAQNYFTDLEYREFIASRFIFNQLQQGLVLTNFALDDDIKTLFKFIDQKRDFDYTLVTREHFIHNVELSDDEVQQYYQSHSDDFYTDEQVKVDYIELKLDTIKNNIEYNDDILKQHYLDTIQIFTEPARFKVAHILLTLDASDAESEQKVLQKLQDLKKRVEAGEDFAALATEFSEDLVSAKKGGELLPFNQGQSDLDPGFEAAVYALSDVGSLSEPVRSKYGYHLIKLLDKEAAVVKSFDEVKTQVADMYTSTKAMDLLYDKADDLVSLTYEFSDNLDKAAETLDLEIQHSDFFARNNKLEGLTSHPAFVKAAFSDEVILDGHNSDLLEIAKNHYAVLRLVEHQQPKLKPFEQVAEGIKKQLTQQKASDLAKAKATEINNQLKESPIDEYKKKQAPFKWHTAKGIDRNDRTLDMQITTKAFEMAHQDSQTVGVVPLINGDYAIVVLTSVQDGTMDDVEEQRVQVLSESMSQNFGSLDLQLFAKEVKDSIKVEKP